MNLDELQSVQARERQSSDLQHLRSSFYREVGEYIQELTDERDELVDDAENPFSVPAVRQLTDDIETAEQTIEAIYERRVGKVVKKASIAAAGMPVGDEGLTAEEADLFEDLVARIEDNRETVLSVLDGGSSAGTYSLPDDASGRPTPETGDEAVAEGGNGDETPTESAPGGVSAADLMGGESGGESGEADDAGGEAEEPPTAVDEAGPSTDEDDSSPREVPPEPAPPGSSPDQSDEGDSDDPSASAGPTASDDADALDDTADSEAQDVPGLPRTTVRITADVGEVVGADDRDYDLHREDVVTLPEPNAEVLVDNDAAERLE